MGNAGGLPNVLRNVGGSIGISLATTYLARSTPVHQAIRVGHLRTDRRGSRGLLALVMGEAGDHRLPLKQSAGALPAINLHDAGCRHRGRESGQLMAGAEPGRAAAEVEPKALQEKEPASNNSQCRTSIGILTSLTSTSAQPLHRSLGTARTNDGGRHRDHSLSGQGEVPRVEVAHYLRQRSAVHREGS